MKNKNRAQDLVLVASSKSTPNLFTTPQSISHQDPPENSTSNTGIMQTKNRGSSRTSSIFALTSDSTIFVQPADIEEDESESNEQKKDIWLERETDTDEKNENVGIRDNRGRTKRLRIPSTVDLPPANDLSSQLNEEDQEVVDDAVVIESSSNGRQGRKRLRMPNLFLDPISFANNRKEDEGDAEGKETQLEEWEQQERDPKRFNLWGPSRRRHLRNDRYAFKLLPKL